MKEGFENSIRKDFEEGARCYQDSRLESLPEEEVRILEEWISVLKQKDEQEAIDILLETFYITAALCNGFRPSEYIDSMLNSKSRQLRKLQIEPDDMFISTENIYGAHSFIEFNAQLRNWLIFDDRSPEFMNSLEDDSEYAFWVGCFLKDSDWENAKEYFQIAIKGSLNKRMRIRALQNIAWICVHLGEFDEAIDSYNQIIELAKINDTKELASKCLGYILALRDYSIDDRESEFMFAPGVEEFAEDGVLRQATEIVESMELKGKFFNSYTPPSYLQQEISKKEAIDSAVRRRVSEQLGFKVDELPADVVDELVNAERVRLLEKRPRQVISDLYQAAANCLQCYIGSRFLPYAHRKVERLPKNIKSLSIYQWAYLFCSLDKQGVRPTDEWVVRPLIMPFRSFVANNLSSDKRTILLSLGEKLRRIQEIRNPYTHQEGNIVSGPPSWRQQMKDLEEMHKLVIGQRDTDSIINQIIRLDISSIG